MTYKKNASNQSGGTLDAIKFRRVSEARTISSRNSKKRRRILKKLPSGQQVYAYASNDQQEDEESDSVVVEGEKKHHTPKFVQHCVSAITEKPGKLADVEAGGPKGKGSPFAICNASYKKKTRSKAAAHATGDHHSVKDYEKSLATLRERTEALRNNSQRANIVFESAPTNPKKSDRRYVRYTPLG